MQLRQLLFVLSIFVIALLSLGGCGRDVQNDCVSSAEKALDNHGLPKDWARAGVFYNMKADPHEAAKRGNAFSQDLLGEMYEGGGTKKRDNAEAVKWYRKAAEQGIQHSQEELAHLYSDGDGVKPDYAESYFWYLISDPALQRSMEHLAPGQRVAIEKRAATWRKAHPKFERSEPQPPLMYVSPKTQNHLPP